MSDQNEGNQPAKPAGGSRPRRSVAPRGGIIAGATASALGAPVGLTGGALALSADVSGELANLAPAFGDVLSSIGLAVAGSQAALDKSLIDTAKKLSGTTITVVSEVIQKLNDDGLPTIEDTELIQNDVSLINYVSPTVHEWKSVALSMDFSVGAVDNETAFTFNRTQHRTSIGTGGIWGFLGWFDMQSSTTSVNVNTRTDYEANWATGQIRLDAMLGPRIGQNFPTPTQIVIGPQIFFSLGTVKETTSSGNQTRAMDVLIKVLKSDGSVNPNVNIVIDSPFPPSFVTDGGFTGSTTNSDGEIKVTFTRTVPAGFRRVPGTVTARLGGVSKSTEITL